MTDSTKLTVDAFEWVHGGNGHALVRLVGTDPVPTGVDVRCLRLSATTADGDPEFPALPDASATPVGWRAAFAVPHSLVDAEETRFEVRLNGGPGIPLGRPAWMVEAERKRRVEAEREAAEAERRAQAGEAAADRAWAELAEVLEALMVSQAAVAEERPRREQAKREVAELRAAVEASEHASTELKAKLEQAEKKAADWQQHAYADRAAADRARAELAGVREALGAAQKARAELAAELNRVSRDAAHEHAGREAAERDAAESGRRADANRAVADRARAEIAELREALADERARWQEVARQAAEFGRRADVGRAAADRARAEVAELREALAAARDARAELQGDMERISAITEAERLRLEDALAAERQARKAEESEARRALRELVAADREVDQLERERSAAQSAVRDELFSESAQNGAPEAMPALIAQQQERQQQLEAAWTRLERAWELAFELLEARPALARTPLRALPQPMPERDTSEAADRVRSVPSH